MNPAIFNKITFEVTATNLNLADTADQTLYTFNSNTSYVRVPKLLILSRRAGTAYTISSFRSQHGQQKNLGKTGEDRLGRPAPFNYEEFDNFIFYYGRAKSSSDTTNIKDFPVFHVNARDLGLLGTTRSGVAALPITDGRTFNTGLSALILRTNGFSISGGTGSLFGEFWYEEVPVNF